MGFGSGGGGFTPSPNNVPGSTRTGTSLTDTHEFTGSVDITGSLTLNGSSITGGGGGGGGAVFTYTNAGDNRVITSVNSNTINGEASLTFDGTKMGVGTSSPTAILHVSSSDTGDLFRVDHNDNSDNPIFVVTGSGRVGIGTATPGAVLDVHPDNGAGFNEIKFRGSAGTSHFYFSAAEHTYIRGGKQTSTVFIADTRNTAGSDNQKCIIGNAASTTAQLHVSSSDNSTVMNVTSNSGSILTALENQRVGIGTGAPQETLSISGSVALSGAFGNRSIETLTANGAISATTGLTIIDASSSLAVNNSLNMTIADGTFIGQEKKIRGMIISGSTGGATSTAINIGGANIDSPPTSPAGSITLSASIPGSGPLFSRAGCTLVWGGTKWLPVGNFNFNINNTGRLF